MNMKTMLALGATAGLAVLTGCGNKTEVPKCEVESTSAQITIACEQPYFRFEAIQLYGTDIATHMHYKNSLGDTVKLSTDNVPSSYNEPVRITFFQVMGHYGFRTSDPDEEPSEREAKLLGRLSGKWLKECSLANCIEEVAKWLETGATIEDRFRSRLGWDETAHSNPVCETTMKQRELNVKCETFEFSATDWGLARGYTITYKNKDGEDVELKANMPINYDVLPEVTMVAGLGVASLGLNGRDTEEWKRLAEDSGKIWKQLCQNIQCIDANNAWLAWRADINPGDEANLQRTDFHYDDYSGYEIWQMAPNRRLIHTSKPRAEYTSLRSYSEPEQTETEYMDEGADETVDAIYSIHRAPYSYQKFERGQEGTEAMFEAADAELAQAKREMGAE